MKKIKIEGELKEEIKKQVDSVNAIRASIEDLSRRAFEMEKRMWKHLRKEFPGQSENCTLTNDGDDIILTDRLAD
jgi:hypothetical protein